MARGQYHGFAFIAVAVLVNHACNTAIVQYKICHPAVEMVFAAVLLYGLSHARYYGAQPVGAYMCVGVDEYLLVGSVFDEFLQHRSYVASFGAAGVELAVAVGPCPAFAETPVAVGVHLMFLGQLGYVIFAVRHRLAALHYHWLQPQLQRSQRSKQPCGSRSHYHHRLCVAAVFIV